MQNILMIAAMKFCQYLLWGLPLAIPHLFRPGCTVDNRCEGLVHSIKDIIIMMDHLIDLRMNGLMAFVSHIGLCVGRWDEIYRKIPAFGHPLRLPLHEVTDSA